MPARRDGARAGRHGAGPRRPAGRRRRRRRSSCCPGRRASCSRCGGAAVETEAFRAALAGASTTDRRCCGCSASRSPRSPRRCAVRRATGVDLDALEITTCLRRGEVEVVTRYEPDAGADLRRAFADVVRERHADTLFSDDGTYGRRAGRRRCCASAAGRSRRPSRAPAGCSAARLTDPAGLVGLRPRRRRRLRPTRRRWSSPASTRALIDAHGAVSAEVAEALADGARERRWAPTSASASPASPGPAAARRRSRSGSSASRSPDRDGVADALGRPAGRRASTSATARRPSRCTWCGGCCSASTTEPCGCSSRSTCRREVRDDACGVGGARRSGATSGCGWSRPTRCT